MELDSRDIHPQQFLMAKRNDELLGFGRIRKHNGCDEFCTLGVIARMQNNGVGKQIVSEIIKCSTQPLYLVCVIPDYFKPYGFEVVENYPVEMQNKLDYCNESLAVKETYVVMRWQPGN